MGPGKGIPVPSEEQQACAPHLWNSLERGRLAQVKTPAQGPPQTLKTEGGTGLVRAQQGQDQGSGKVPGARVQGSRVIGGTAAEGSPGEPGEDVGQP